MKLTSFLSTSQIYCEVAVSSKKRCLEVAGSYLSALIEQTLVASGESATPTDECFCFEQLIKREKLGCTAINQGVALPHAKLPDNLPDLFKEPLAVFLRLENAIDYEASDHKEVDLVFALLFPTNYCEQYRRYLPYAAEKLSDKNTLKQLRNAENAEQIWQILDEIEPLELIENKEA